MKIWQKFLIVLALIGAVVFVVEHKKRQGFICAGGACPPPALNTRPVVSAETPAQKPLPRLVDLGSGSCVPCKLMTPVLDELKTTCAGKLEVVFIDVRDNPQAGQQYGIRTIPTQIFYDAAGKELFRHEGFFAKDEILAKWKELGVQL